MKALLGKKLGMTRIFTEDGDHVPVTVIQAGPCFITQIKTVETDGYNALQLGFEETREKLVTNSLRGHFKKAGAKPLKYLGEFRLDNVESVKLGDCVDASNFAEGEALTISGVSKGRGFAGVMKRHGFSGAQITHGQSDRQRAPGSIGQCSDPSRVFKGLRMAGRMGGDKIQISRLKIVKIDKERNLIFVKGSVPGANNGLLEIVSNV